MTRPGAFNSRRLLMGGRRRRGGHRGCRRGGGGLSGPRRRRWPTLARAGTGRWIEPAGQPRRRRARGDSDAGEPLVRPLLRHHAWCARVRPTPPRSRCVPPARSQGGVLLPFHVDTDEGSTATARGPGPQLARYPHSLGEREYNDWIAAKSELTMAHFDQSDIPVPPRAGRQLHHLRQLLLPIQGPTTPTGCTVHRHDRPTGTGRRAAICEPAGLQPGCTAGPPTGAAAGGRVSWRVYANKEVGDGGGGDGYVGDYGDNPLWLFHAYHDALASSTRPAASWPNGPACTRWLPNSGKGHDVKHVLSEFLDDLRVGRLPKVSWWSRRTPTASTRRPARWTRQLRCRPCCRRSRQRRPVEVHRHLPETSDENDGFFDTCCRRFPPPNTPLEFCSGPADRVGPGAHDRGLPVEHGGWVKLRGGRPTPRSSASWSAGPGCTSRTSPLAPCRVWRSDQRVRLP